MTSTIQSSLNACGEPVGGNVSLPKCRTKYCRGYVLPSFHSPYCSKCKARRWAKSSPVAYHFNKLKYRALERGHQFGLTVEEYARFWFESGYGERHGKTAQSLSINRLDNRRGYFADNIEAIPLSVNARLRFAPQYSETTRATRAEQ